MKERLSNPGLFDKHDQFANGLELILPELKDSYDGRLRVRIIERARQGQWYAPPRPEKWPSAFERSEIVPLMPAIKELWYAVYGPRP